MNEQRPDFSKYLAHFTSDSDNESNNDLSDSSAFEKLISILEDQTVVASILPWVNRKAVCFTECPWASLIDHAEHYSPYGLGFTKPHVFASGGSPAYYVRPDHWEKQDWDDHVKIFATPFWPAYRPVSRRGDEYLDGQTIDYSQEREWRVPHNFNFDFDQVSFVIVDTYKDVARFPKKLKDEIGRENFLIMDVYRKIETLWPVHNVAT